MSALTLYFLVMLDSIKTLGIVIMSAGWCAYVIYLVAVLMAICVDDKGDLIAPCKKNTKIWVPILTLITFITFMIPTTKQVAFIYIASTLSQNKIVQDIGEKSLQIPDKALEILNLKMNEYLDDMKKEAVSEVKETTKEVKKEIVK